MKYIIIHFNKKIYKINRELNESIDVFYKELGLLHKERYGYEFNNRREYHSYGEIIMFMVYNIIKK